MEIGAFSILLLVLSAILFWLSAWINLDTWNCYKKQYCQLLELNSLKLYLDKMNNGPNRVLTELRNKPDPISTLDRQRMAKVLKFNSKDLVKSITDKNRGK